jgi:hypothetical protein
LFSGCFEVYTINGISLDNSVSIVTGYMQAYQRMRFLAGAEIFLFAALHCPDQFWDPSSLVSNKYPGTPSRMLKWLEHDPGHSSTYSTIIKSVWSLNLYIFMA